MTKEESNIKLAIDIAKIRMAASGGSKSFSNSLQEAMHDLDAGKEAAIMTEIDSIVATDKARARSARLVVSKFDKTYLSVIKRKLEIRSSEATRPQVKKFTKDDYKNASSLQKDLLKLATAHLLAATSSDSTTVFDDDAVSGNRTTIIPFSLTEMYGTEKELIDSMNAEITNNKRNRLNYKVTSVKKFEIAQQKSSKMSADDKNLGDTQPVNYYGTFIYEKFAINGYAVVTLAA